MSKIFDQLVEQRGITADFLRPKYEDTVDSMILPGMEQTIERIKKAIDNGEKILIYGDYDVDGVTASTVMHDTLKLAGVQEVEIMLPNRFTDGYGMSNKIVQRAGETGVKLVITVDCGSRNHEIVRQLTEIGVDTIITDHHECEETLPEAVAVINPKRRDISRMVASQNLPEDELERRLLELNELRELAGVGVAFKVAQALVRVGLIPEGQEKWLLDLVLIGTICDSMRLTHENRRLCYYGLKVIEKTRRVGLKELFRLAQVKRFDGDTIGFQIGPRLNAAGRIEDAGIALNLLMAKNRTEAANIAAQLEKLNSTRKEKQLAAVNEIASRGVGDQPVAIECGDWHEGVLGIIAGRLVEEYKKPAFVLAECDGVLKGSGRSFGDFSLAEALVACKEQILGGGGHAEACGVKIPLDGLEAFRKAMNEYYDSLGLFNQERFLEVRGDLETPNFEELSLELVQELRQMEPFGMGNEVPIFMLTEVRVADAARLGNKGQHLRLTVWDRNGKSLKLMCFGAPEKYLGLTGGETVNAWISLEENVFRGIRSVEGRILRLEVV